ncbi:MAG: hypothetical protein AUJ92_06885 [Armatimonadetes bacterium CG2_30_59_28]|nr:response regulator [Armatimonadota bacterium]OIO96078.1 MAG: hypothetical protein AUJ92_06885 [Armatimonadetes bacterium CG2_30_59_28]
MNELKPTILVVDDEPGIREILCTALETEGYQCISAEDGQTGLSIAQHQSIAVALLDIHMPGMDGIETLQYLREMSPDTVPIMVTGETAIDTAVEAIKQGAFDYVVKPFRIDIVSLSVKRALEKRQLMAENQQYRQNLEEKVKSQTAEIRKQKDCIDALFLDTVAALAVALETKDHYTEGHSRRVTDYSILLGRQAGVDDGTLIGVERGGLLHDIGKIGTPDAVLTKQGKLTDEEYREIQKHTIHGATIVSRIRHMDDVVRQCVRSHHERWDGQGYPDGLGGEEIPLAGRVMGIADAFDAMTSSRSYRDTLTVQQALEQIRVNRGKQFDPDLADTFLRSMNQNKGSGGNILVVDDDRAIAELFAASLVPQGHRVVTANSGFQAMRKVAEEPFDIVYLDVNMPGIDGAQTLRAMKELRPQVFVVVITGHHDDERIGQMIEDGAITCLPKPIGVRQIIDTTASFLKGIFED